MTRFRFGMIASVALALGACGGGSGGGGGGQVASAPPPAAFTSMAAYTKSVAGPELCGGLNSCTATVTPLGPSPADKAATFGTIAIKRETSASGTNFRPVAEADDLQIKVNPASGSYTLILEEGSTPKIERTYSATSAFGNHVVERGLTKPGYSETGQLITPGGTLAVWEGDHNTISADSRNNNQFQYRWGLSHVSLGVWAAPDTPFGSINDSAYYFVHGNPTPVSEIPVSGNANYRIEYADGTGLEPERVDLSIDFAARTLHFAAENPAVRDVFEDGVAWGDGFAVSGSATLGPSSNRFVGALTGTLFHFVDGNNSGDLVNIGLSGQISGGLFGPQASQIGAVWFASSPTGDLSVSGAFVGQKN